MAHTIDGLTYRDVAKTIDHSLLRPELDDAQVEAGCVLAATYDVASVCVRPADVAPRPTDPRRDGCRGRHDDRLPARQPPDRDQGLRVGPCHRGRRAGAGHGHRDRGPQVGSRRRRRGGYPGRRERRPRGSRDRQGHLRERLPDRRREDPRLPPHRSRRWRLRQDVHGVRPDRRDPRRPATHACQHVPAHPGQGRGRRQDARRAARGVGARGRPGSARPRPRRSSTTSRARTAGDDTPAARPPGAS